MDVCICVPVYDDWDNAGPLVEDFVGCNYNGVTLMIIDNGSKQQNEPLARRIQEIENVSVVRIETNLGFGGAIQEATKVTKADWLVWMPGNMKVLTSEMSDFISLLRSCPSSTFVKAKRIGRPVLDRIKTMLASVAQTIFAGKIMVDTGGTPCAVHRSNPLWREILSAPTDYRFDSYMLYAARNLGLRVERPKVFYHERLVGTSHWQSGFSAELQLMKSLIRSIISWRIDESPKRRSRRNG
jgi:glycosyltransferase involved in cell wall biosynthesis